MVKTEELIKSLLTFIDTLTHKHQGRLKGIGIDCAGLIVEVIKEVGLDASFDLKGW